MNNKLTKQEKEKLSNKTVFFSSVTISYAILLLFIQKMSMSSLTVNGAVSLISLLHWLSLCGAMGCAAWSAYKEKKGFFLYCAMCIFVFFSTTVLKNVSDTRAYPINYIALAVAFVMAQIYYALKVHNRFTHTMRNIFVAVTVLTIGVLALGCLPTEFLHGIINK